jgi:3-deoxy-D-arabino-heptulosonate 7-phosphate (DAHP) synthase
MIIIGILAAIPVFLNQQDQAREAAAQSDLRNAAAFSTAGRKPRTSQPSSCIQERQELRERSLRAGALEA